MGVRLVSLAAPVCIALGAGPLTACGSRDGLAVGVGGASSSSSASSSGGATLCVVAPWTNTPAQLTSGSGDDDLPPGTYTLRYMDGAMMYNSAGYEVTEHYVSSGVQCGHHLYDSADPSSSTTDVWLDSNGLVDGLPSVAAVEQANAGHTWSIEHAGGPLFITYLDDLYSDNQGPGSRFCVTSSP